MSMSVHLQYCINHASLSFSNNIYNSQAMPVILREFLARQHIYCSALYASGRPSVCLSVRPSRCLSHGWISQKRLKLGSSNFDLK